MTGVGFVKKRAGYTAEEKAQCREVVAKVRAEGRAARLLRQMPGFEKVARKQLHRWMKPVAKKMWRPAPTAFAAASAVLDELE